MVKNVRVTYRRRHSYATKSNGIKAVKTPGTLSPPVNDWRDAIMARRDRWRAREMTRSGVALSTGGEQSMRAAGSRANAEPSMGEVIGDIERCLRRNLEARHGRLSASLG